MRARRSQQADLQAWRRRFPSVQSLALTAGALLLICLSAACSRPSAQRLNEDGNRAFNRGDYPQALEDYRKAQVERPDLSTFNYNAGNVLHQQGEYPRAVAESLRATSVGEMDVRVRAFYSVGADYYREGKLKEALDAYKNALRLDPNDLDTKYNVEVIQRRLDKEAEQRRMQDEQAMQEPKNAPGQQQDQQGQPRPQPTQGPQQRQQPGQQLPDQQGQQPGQPQPGQQGQPDPNAQAGQPGQQVPPQGSTNQPGGAPSAASSPGVQGTPGPNAPAQQAQLNQDLKNAIDAYNKAPSIEEALRILDIIAEQERITQAEQGSRGDPRVRDK